MKRIMILGSTGMLDFLKSNNGQDSRLGFHVLVRDKRSIVYKIGVGLENIFMLLMI